MTAIRQGQVTLFDSRSRAHEIREARMQPHTAILIEGAGGGLEIIAVTPERYDEEGYTITSSTPAAQLEARAKRLYKGQNASLITYYKNETVER